MAQKNRTSQVKWEREQKKRERQQKKAEKAARKRERRDIRNDENAKNLNDTETIKIDLPLEDPSKLQEE